MTLSDGALTVFWWLVDLTACGVLVSWITVLLNHWRLMAAMKAQKLELARLPWHSRWTGMFDYRVQLPESELTYVLTEYSTPVALVLCVIILFTAGFPTFTKGNWSTSGFISSYLLVLLKLKSTVNWLLTWTRRDIPLVITAYVVWKIYKGTKIVSLIDIPLEEALARAEQDIEPEPKQPGWRKAVGFLWD